MVLYSFKGNIIFFDQGQCDDITSWIEHYTLQRIAV